MRGPPIGFDAYTSSFRDVIRCHSTAQFYGEVYPWYTLLAQYAPSVVTSGLPLSDHILKRLLTHLVVPLGIEPRTPGTSPQCSTN